MPKQSLQDVMEKKNYYRDVYRKSLRWLQYMLAINVVFLLAIIQIYLTREEPNYYATNSASSIKLLLGMNEPNHSSEALLPPDRPEELGIKSLSL